MKRLAGIVFVSLVLLPGAAAQPVSLAVTHEELAQLTAVSGYEERVTAWLAEWLKKFNPEVDNLGNVVVTLGAGAPHRLLVTPIDEPGYVVSAITPEGYLRLQRLPQSPPSSGQAGVHPWFDVLHAAQPVEILTRSGKLVPGVIAGLSTHLHRDLSTAERTDQLDRLYVDVGARSAEEVRALGVDLLDPLALEKNSYWLSNSERTAPFISARAGAAALVHLLGRLDPVKLDGTLTVAFVVRRYVSQQGLERVLRRFDAGEVFLLQPLERGEAEPGAGVLVANVEGGEPALAADLLRLARENHVRARAELAEPAPRGRYTGEFPLPARTAIVGIPVRFPQTPAEVVSHDDLQQLSDLLGLYIGLLREELPLTGVGGSSAGGATRQSVEDYLRDLATVYGVSGHEGPVAERIIGMLPPDAREWATQDGKGNVFLPFGRPSEKPRLIFVAHMDEIGWEVADIRHDGRLVLARRGGFLEEYFLGRAVLVHTAEHQVPAVLELPADYRTAAYQPAPGREHVAYIGARTRAEAEARGIQVGDSVTVPKKYRRLAGRRANARSFDDRVGSTALIAAAWQLWRRLVPGEPLLDKVDREVIFVWAVEEEIGLEGAKHFAARAAEEGGMPEFVFAVDTFVSGDSPLESPRFAGAQLGEGFVVRAVDNSNVAPRAWVDRVVEIARRNNIPVQYGVTAGGNDGAAFVPYGAVDIPLGWPLRYSHSAAEVADLSDVEALARIVAALALEF
ncbi:MAG: M20/M25/M40 family metallo-hydrolase [Acidobacteria bacterium]|nr:M20/M25/M40 family metallo-hydrolase [Acidobacteriota bacterium]